MRAVKEAHEIEASLSSAPCSTFDSEHLENKGIMDPPPHTHKEQVSKIHTLKRKKRKRKLGLLKWFGG